MIKSKMRTNLDPVAPPKDITLPGHSLHNLERADVSRDRLQGRIDFSQVRRELAELQLSLTPSRGPQAKQQITPRADHGQVGSIIETAVANLSKVANATGRLIDVQVTGAAQGVAPPNNFAEAVHEMLWAVLAAAEGPVILKAVVGDDIGSTVLTIEASSKVLDVSDSARKKLTKIAGAYGGETTFISARTASSLRIKIPLLLASPDLDDTDLSESRLPLELHRA